ncbi:MAG: hypothetical protein ACJ8HU_11175 [Chthoniobacterales bacterium]
MFSAKKLILFAAIFCAAFAAANLILFELHKLGLNFHYIPSWPINVFGPSEMTRHYRLLVSLALLAVFFVAQRLLAKVDYRLPLVIIAGFALIIGSNLIQGFEEGFADPITADEFNDEQTPQYYHDAVEITDAGEFFRNYNAIQRTLHMHARTHPPGPVLLIYALNRALKEPALISLAIAVLAVTTAAWFFYKLLVTELQPHLAGFMTSLFLLLPSVQIYYLATVDALVAALLLGVFYCFKRATALHLFAAAALLVTSFMLTFLAVWIVPVLFGYELIKRRNIIRATAVVLAVIAVYVAIYFASGFNLLASFRTASAIENEHGFMLLHNPLDYFVSRLQSIGEVMLFFGPYLCLLFVRSVRGSQRHIATWLALGSFALLLAAGTFRVGETARICNFLYPFLLLPIARYLNQRNATEAEKAQLAWLVFGQTILMQAAGSYFW